jgi:hypothetical protein
MTASKNANVCNGSISPFHDLTPDWRIYSMKQTSVNAGQATQFGHKPTVSAMAQYTKADLQRLSIFPIGSLMMRRHGNLCPAYQCEHCQLLLRPTIRHCCVFCSFGSVKCRSVQERHGYCS